MPSSKKHSRTAKRRRGGAFGDTFRRLFGIRTNSQAGRIRAQRLNAIHNSTMKSARSSRGPNGPRLNSTARRRLLDIEHKDPWTKERIATEKVKQSSYKSRSRSKSRSK